MTLTTRVLGAAVLLEALVIAILLTAPSLLTPVYAPHIDSFQRTGDPRQIIANVTIGLGDQILGSSTTEDAQSVRVSVRVRRSEGSKPAVGIFVPVPVLLGGPLGDRAVLDPSGDRPRDLGQYQIPREPPLDLSTAISQIDRASYRTSGDAIDFRWTNFNGTKTESLADLRGSTVVIVSRTPNSSDAKINIGWLEEYIASAPTERLVVLVVTLSSDPAAAIALRPSTTWRSLITLNDLGADAPEIFRLSATPTTWFVGPEGAVRQRYSKTALTREQVLQGIAIAR